MKSFTSIFLTLRYFLTVIAFFLVVSFIFVVFVPKMQLHLFINSFHARWSDIFFKYYTHIGDGVFAIILLPYFLFFGKLRDFLMVVLACSFAGLTAQIFKRLLFANSIRPSGVFDSGILHLVDGVNLHQSYSFPSGHSASAFAFFVAIAFLLRKYKKAQITLGILAILAAFSRVYLSQHFLIDTCAGGFIGILTFFLSYRIISYLNTHFVYELCIWRFIQLSVGKTKLFS